MAVSVNGSGSKIHVETKSPHVSDATIEPFLQRDFDPIDYLNTSLPSLSVSAASKSSQSTTYGRAVTLPELSSQLQTVLAQLNAQTSRLSSALTQLTDEIVRSGGRLAYEVELLRGETIGLQDSLENKLREDIDVFTASHIEDKEDGEEKADVAENRVQSESETLERLETLTTVRSRLDSVIKVFGDAMQWQMAPSELSTTSSIISVSAPEAAEDVRSREEKGKAYAEKLRSEINDLLNSSNDLSAVDAAVARLEDLKHLAGVWRGTSEEKPRLKLIESLQKQIDDRQKSLEKSSIARKSTPAPARGMDYRYGGVDSTRLGSDGGYGFLQNLRDKI